MRFRCYRPSRIVASQGSGPCQSVRHHLTRCKLCTYVAPVFRCRSCRAEPPRPILEACCDCGTATPTTMVSLRVLTCFSSSALILLTSFESPRSRTSSGAVSRPSRGKVMRPACLKDSDGPPALTTMSRKLPPPWPMRFRCCKSASPDCSIHYQTHVFRVDGQ